MNVVTVTTTSGSTFTQTATVDFGEPTLKVNDTITVTDNNTGTLGSGVTTSKSFEYTMTLDCKTQDMSDYIDGEATGVKSNLASFVASDDDQGSDDADVDVACYIPVVTKDADTTYTLTTTWEITKAVTPVYVELYQGDSETLSYTVIVTKQGHGPRQQRDVLRLQFVVEGALQPDRPGRFELARQWPAGSGRLHDYRILGTQLVAS
jgi:hypothetical protein